MKKRIALMLLAGILSMTLCGYNTDSEEKKDLVEELQLNGESKEASQYTAEINSAVYDLLDFSDTQEAEFAVQGLIAAPDTVNPSLWENTKNNHAYGLFKVMDGIYQVRGYDMANLTVVEGENSWIVFDTTMGVECAQAAMQLINENLGERPVSAVIISHSHVDHFGGIRGVVNEEDIADASLSLEEQIASGKIPVIVPEGFEDHAVSENLYAEPAMARRASYQYSGDIIRNMSVENIFDYMDILLDKKALSSEGFSIQFILTDTGDQTMIRLVNGVILQFEDYKSDDADLTVTTVKNGLLYLLQGNID